MSERSALCGLAASSVVIMVCKAMAMDVRFDNVTACEQRSAIYRVDLMPKYENLYLISPALCFSEIEKDIEKIRICQKQQDEIMIGFRDLADKILASRVGDMSNPAVFVKRWRYDARFPSYVLNNVYGIEKENGVVKRWVGPERFVELSMFLNRSSQYTFKAKIVNFINEYVKSQFILTINDEEIPWISEDDLSYMAIIPENYEPNASDTTRILLGCRDGAQPPPAEGDQRTLWFSLSSIEIALH